MQAALEHQAPLAQQFTVVAGEHHHRVVVQPQVAQPRHHAAHRIVDAGQAAVVERDGLARLLLAAGEGPVARPEARLALALHDELAARLELDDEDRELLEAAALLCNVGLFISHSKHHKHSYYVIRNSEHLMGFTDNEIELIAQIARYHRKSPPSEDKHPEFAALPAEARSKVRSLASILRVAIGLDRNHDGAVEQLRVRDAGDVIEILIAPAPGSDDDLALEAYSANDRSRFLADRLGTPVRVCVVEPEPAVGAVPDVD